MSLSGIGNLKSVTERQHWWQTDTVRTSKRESWNTYVDWILKSFSWSICKIRLSDLWSQYLFIREVNFTVFHDIVEVFVLKVFSYNFDTSLMETDDSLNCHELTVALLPKHIHCLLWASAGHRHSPHWCVFLRILLFFMILWNFYTKSLLVQLRHEFDGNWWFVELSRADWCVVSKAHSLSSLDFCWPAAQSTLMCFHENLSI